MRICGKPAWVVFAVGAGFVGCCLLGLCLLLLALFFDLPWSLLGEGAQRRYLEDLVEHYQPIVDAVGDYEQQHLRPPSLLEELVPRFIEVLPDLDPGLVTSFSYSGIENLVPGAADAKGNRYLWYDLSLPQEECRLLGFDELEPRPSHAHLVIVLDDAEVIRDAFVDPPSPAVAGGGFDSAAWRASPAGRRGMVGAVLRDISVEGRRFQEAEALLGVPDGGGRFESYWTMFVEVGFPTLDSPGLGFMSSTGMDAPGAWSYGGWEFPAEGR